MSKATHNILVRAAVQATGQLQALAGYEDTPEHLLVYIEAVLETLHRGMMGQPMADEKVVIGVVDGAPVVVQKTSFVTVEIVTQGAAVENETILNKEG